MVVTAVCALVIVVALLTESDGDGPRSRLPGQLTEPRERRPTLRQSVVSSAAVAAGALRRRGYDTDYSVASLRELDRFFTRETTGAGRPRPGGVLDRQPENVLSSLGAYVAEVLRRAGGGRLSDGDGT